MKKDGVAIDIEDVRTIAQQKGKLLSVTFEQRRRDGRRQKREREIYDHGNSAVVLPCDPHRGTVLITRQLRLPIYLQDGIDSSIEACTGKLDGERPEVRMLKE